MNSHNRFISKEVLTHKECEPIIINCLTCNELFDTLLVVKDNQPYDYCCSIKCYNKYHSIENIRDRKLQNLLNGE
jgi:hypothetical protein